MNSIGFFIHKELLHIKRDPLTLAILIAMPLVLVTLFGYAIRMEFNHTPFVVYDQAQTVESRQIVQKMDANAYFDFQKMVKSPEELHSVIRKGKARMGLILRLADGRSGAVDTHVIADATNPSEATSVTQYAKQVLGNSSEVGVKPVVRLLFNPLMESAYNFVPGVMGMILLLICTLMTSVCVVREKEQGSMEILLVSPIRPLNIIVAKMIPYMLIGTINIFTVLGVSYFLLGVPIHGSFILLMLFTFLYIIVSLLLGVFISTVVNSQQAAMMISVVGLMLPTMLLSGMVFPIENMPVILQSISLLLPARWYIDSLRLIMIEGVGWNMVWLDGLILMVMAVMLVVMSVKRFKIRL